MRPLQELINDRDVPAYLSHVERRLREENERLLHYLDTSSKWQLIHTVEKQLILEHLADILSKGLDSLLEENRCRGTSSRVAMIQGVGVAWIQLFSQKESESDSGLGSK